MLPKFLEDLNPDVYKSENYVVLDFETDTSHGDFGNAIHGDNQLLLGVWKTSKHHRSGQRTSTIWGGEFDYARLVADINSADFLVAQHAKYELGWLRRAGLDLRSVLVFDTKLAEYVLLGNLAAGDKKMLPRSTSLDMLCRRRGLPIKDPVVDLMMSRGINPVRMPRSWLEGRCRQDVDTTEVVFKDQLQRLVNTGRLPVLYTRSLLTPVLADIEPEGMALDYPKVAKAYEEHVVKLAALDIELKEFTKGINWRSSKQAAVFIYDVLKFDELRKKDGKPKRTKPSAKHPEGQRKADQKTLDVLVARTPEQVKFLDMRKRIGKVAALLSKNLEFFMGVCSEKDGIFHAEFNQMKTATHRLSSTGIELHFRMFLDKTGKKTVGKKVQFQNMPRSFKELFKARREGWLMGEADGSQLEFRVAAELGQDKQAIADIENPDYDAHVFTASQINGVALSAVTTDGQHSMRQLAKPNTFKPLYGGSKGTTEEERYFKAFKERYKGIAATQEDWVAEVVATKRLITPWGMRYYWPYAEMGRRGYVNVTSAVYNYPVQALATAEIIPIALVYFWHRLADEGLTEYVRIVNTVHDSIVCEVHPDYTEQFRDLAKRCFTIDVYRYLRRVYGMAFKVPLGCGTKVGEYWGKGKEVTWDVWPNGRERVKVK